MPYLHPEEEDNHNNNTKSNVYMYGACSDVTIKGVWSEDSILKGDTILTENSRKELSECGFMTLFFESLCKFRLKIFFGKNFPIWGHTF